jgi:hypothetical protein
MTKPQGSPPKMVEPEGGLATRRKRRWSHREVERPYKDDDEAGGRFKDLMKTMPMLQGGLAT